MRLVTEAAQLQEAPLDFHPDPVIDRMTLTRVRDRRIPTKAN
jgi:hypothetical protein